MISLTELHLRGALGPGDVAALRRAEHLPHNLESLRIVHVVFEGELEDFVDFLKDFLGPATRLRSFMFDMLYCPDLSFLAAAQLPNLEDLTLLNLHKVSLHPFACISRPRLQSLTLRDDPQRHSPPDLLPLVSAGPETFPALESLIISLRYFQGFNFMPQMALSTLKSLELFGAWDADDVANLAAGLAHLPALEVLDLYPIDWVHFDHRLNAPRAMRALMSGATFPRLRQLTTRGQWVDNDESLKVMIEFAEKRPCWKKSSSEKAPWVQMALLRWQRRGTGGCGPF